MAFKLVGALRGAGMPSVKPFIVANSAALKVGEAVGLDGDGFVLRVAAGSRLLGVVQGFVSSITGEPVDMAETDTFTAESDNETVDKIAALIVIDPEAVYSVDLDADLGTTPGSDTPGAMFDTPAAAYGTLDESTATHTYGTGGQVVSLGIDPKDSERLHVRIHERLLS